MATIVSLVNVAQGRPSVLKCDYCGILADQMWFRAVREFTLRPDRLILEPVLYEGGSWGACVYCRNLLLDGNLEALTARATVMLAREGPSFIVRQLVTNLFQAVRYAYCEESSEIPWEAGQPVRCE